MITFFKMLVSIVGRGGINNIDYLFQMYGIKSSILVPMAGVNGGQRKFDM